MPRNPKADLIIRSWRYECDNAAIAAIQHELFGSHWTGQALQSWDADKSTGGLVAEHQLAIAGYALYRIHRSSLDVTCFGVEPWYQRQGVGAALFEKFKSLLNAHRRRLTCTVRERELDVQLFLKACGLRYVATFRDFYTDDEAGYQFRFEIGQHARQGVS